MKARLHCLCLLTICLAAARVATAQGTAFTYQGVLSQNGAAVNGSNDLTFTLYTAVSGGGIVGTSNVVNDLVMTNGLFTVTLDFGATPFIGNDRWLQMAVRPGASTGAYTNLLPRQPITATPYALFAAGANASTLIGSLPSTGLAGTYSAAVTLNNAGNVFSGNGSNLTALNASQLTSGTVPAAALGNAWKPTGNAGTTPGTHFLGTTDNQPLDFRVNNQRGLRLEYQNSVFNDSVNVIGGYRSNQVSPGIVGATISGGGALNIGGSAPNRVTGDFGTVGGGNLNTASGQFAATVGGGQQNTASGDYATVPGGFANTATHYAFSAGNRAKANHQGAFVWADSTAADFASMANNQFLIRASGGVGIGTANPQTTLDVRSTTPAITVGNPGGEGGALYFGNPGHGVKRAYNGINDVGLYTTAADLYLSANGPNTTNFVLKNSGNVGIGTVSPSGKLDVAGNILASGNVGIGTVAPATKLHLLGSDDTELSIQSAANNRRWTLQASGGTDGVGSGGTLQIIDRTAGASRMSIGTSGNVTFGGNVTSGGEVTTTAVNITSDRNAKEQFKPVNAREVLAKVARLPITEWQYKTQSDARHIGPMAQDFREAFALGRDEKHITSVDADGVALAAIQGLNQKLEEKTQEVDALKKSVAALTELVNKLAAQQNGGAR